MPRIPLIAIAAVTMVIAACDARSGADAGHPNLDLNYQIGPSAERTGMKLALIEPQLRSAADEPESVTQQQPQQPFAQLTTRYKREARLQLEPSDETPVDFQGMFQQRYAQQLSRALGDGIEKVLAAKGFDDSQSYASYDAMLAANREAFLVSLPTATIAITSHDTSRECTEGYCVTRGVIKLEGQFLYQLVEPITGQTVVIRRMNLWGLKTEEPYTVERRQRTEGFLDRLRFWFGADRGLEDTSEQALAKAVSKFYKQALDDVDLIVSRQRILDLKQAIENLKTSESQQTSHSLEPAGG